MSTVKITDLPEITHLDNSTANTIMLGVDIDSDTTAKFTVTTLAEGLFHNNSLKVGEEPITFSNTIAQFKSSGTPFLQVNLQNTDANSSGDYVVTADIGTNANNFIDMGINGSTFTDTDYSAMQALDGYLYVQGSLSNSTNGNLVIGTASTGANVVIAPGGTTTENVVAHFTKNGLVLMNDATLEFADGTIQETGFLGTQHIGFYSNTIYNSVSMDYPLMIAPGGEGGAASEAYIHLPGNNDALTQPITIRNALLGGISLVTTSSHEWLFDFNGTLTFPDDTQQTTAYSSDVANIINNNTTNITYVNQYAASGYAKANNALANTTGTFNGSLTVNGSIIFPDSTEFAYNPSASPATFMVSTANGFVVRTDDAVSPKDFSFGTDGTLVVPNDLTVTSNLNVYGVNHNFVNSSPDANHALVQITASENGDYVAPSNSYYMLHITGKADNATRVVMDAFGGNTYPVIIGRHGMGSAGSPEACSNNSVMMRIAGNGYTGTQFPMSGPTKIDFVATENFSDSNRGSAIQFWNTPNGSNTIQKIAQFNASEVSFTGTVNPTKGFIYTPVIYPGAQTAITLDISDGPLVRAQTSSGLVVTLSNYTAGKVIELWVTNLAGSTQTFTHGVSAINSTVGATSVSMAGGTTISARYVCLDGTLANTMCAITGV